MRRCLATLAGALCAGACAPPPWSSVDSGDSADAPHIELWFPTPDTDTRICPVFTASAVVTGFTLDPDPHDGSPKGDGSWVLSDEGADGIYLVGISGSELLTVPPDHPFPPGGHKLVASLVDHDLQPLSPDRSWQTWIIVEDVEDCLDSEPLP